MRLTEQRRLRFRFGAGGTCDLLQLLREVSVGLHGVHPVAEVPDGPHIPACATPLSTDACAERAESKT